MIRFKIATRTTVCIITSAMLLLLGCSNSKKIENQVSENSPVKSANEKVSLPEIVTVSTDEKGFASLSDVAHNSKVIVVATISGDGGSDSLLNLFAKEKTTPPGNLENPIITPYKAKVKEVLKGDIKEGDILKIYQEGGIYKIRSIDIQA